MRERRAEEARLQLAVARVAQHGGRSEVEKLEKGLKGG